MRGGRAGPERNLGGVAVGPPRRDRRPAAARGRDGAGCVQAGKGWLVKWAEGRGPWLEGWVLKGDSLGKRSRGVEGQFNMFPPPMEQRRGAPARSPGPPRASQGRRDAGAWVGPGAEVPPRAGGLGPGRRRLPGGPRVEGPPFGLSQGQVVAASRWELGPGPDQRLRHGSLLPAWWAGGESRGRINFKILYILALCQASRTNSVAA
jgi:hypothetical protein